MVITLNKNRVVSSLVAFGYVVAGVLAGGVGGGFIAFVFVILPLACIWFSDAMGGFTGIAGSVGVTASSPGLFVCIAGWILLLLPIIVEIIDYVSA
jgi:hypothetical protein